MCFDVVYLYYNCSTTEIYHYLCSDHIAHTFSQKDDLPCPFFKTRTLHLKDEDCNCKLTQKECCHNEVEKVDGIYHIHSFERDERLGFWPRKGTWIKESLEPPNEQDPLNRLNPNAIDADTNDEEDLGMPVRDRSVGRSRYINLASSASDKENMFPQQLSLPGASGSSRSRTFAKDEASIERERYGRFDAEIRGYRAASPSEEEFVGFNGTPTRQPRSSQSAAGESMRAAKKARFSYRDYEDDGFQANISYPRNLLGTYGESSGSRQAQDNHAATVDGGFDDEEEDEVPATLAGSRASGSGSDEGAEDSGSDDNDDADEESEMDSDKENVDPTAASEEYDGDGEDEGEDEEMGDY